MKSLMGFWIMFSCFSFLGCQTMSGLVGLPTPAKCDGVAGSDVVKMIAEKINIDKVRIEMTDDFYSLPNKSEFVDALLVAKSSLGIKNKSDRIGTISGAHPVIEPRSVVITRMDEQGLCMGGIDKILGEIDKYQTDKDFCEWPWPVGVASDFSGLRCLIFVATKDDGILFFDANKLYEDGAMGDVDQILF